MTISPSSTMPTLASVVYEPALTVTSKPAGTLEWSPELVR